MLQKRDTDIARAGVEINSTYRSFVFPFSNNALGPKSGLVARDHRLVREVDTATEEVGVAEDLFKWLVPIDAPAVGLKSFAFQAIVFLLQYFLLRRRVREIHVYASSKISRRRASRSFTPAVVAEYGTTTASCASSLIVRSCADV